MGRVAAASVILLLLIPPPASAASFELASAVGAATIVPVTLAVGSDCKGQCTTALNAAATSATVGTLNIVPNPSQQRQVIQLVHGNQAWSVQVRVIGASLGASDSVVLGLSGSSTASLTLTSVTPLPASSAAVPLPGGTGATDVTLTARGSCAATCVIAAELLLSSGTTDYAYLVSLTAT